MLRKMILLYRIDRLKESHRFLLIYAQLIALIHGIGFLTQLPLYSTQLIKYAFGNPDAWHGGLPALSFFHLSIYSGLFTTLLSVVSLALVIKNLHRWYHWPLMFIVFVSGGGFVYFWIALITRSSLCFPKKNQRNGTSSLGEILIITLFIWFFASWFLGWVFPIFMANISLVTFFIFDIIIPVMIIWFHRHLKQNSPSEKHS